MTESDGYIVGLFSSACAHIEQSDSPRSCLAVESGTAEDRHRCSGRIESNTSRVKKLSSPRCADVEQPARLQEELPLLRKESRESGEIDYLLVGLDLREVGVDCEIGSQRRRYREFGIDPEFCGFVRRCYPRAGRFVGWRDQPAQDVRTQLDWTVTADVVKSGDVTRIEEILEALRSAPRSPQVLLVLAPDDSPNVQA